ncbi:MAG: alpha/beta fold hydrolase [Chloroflexi bacterium]|nr:alpha/beta fold hydrolase [Chloroflexota bacterium]
MKSKLGWFIGIIILLLALIYLGGSYYFSTILLDLPTQTLADGQARMMESNLLDPALPPPEAVTIDAGDVTLTGNFYENEKDGDCAVLLLHGYTGTHHGVMQYTPLFWDRGCDLLAYNARGHGDSTAAYHTYGYHEKADGQAAYNWLLDRSELEPSQVGLTGVSYGAATVLQMLPLTPDAAFVLSDSPYQDLRTIVAHQGEDQFGSWVNIFVPSAFFIAELRADFDADEVSPHNAVAGTTTPVLIMHSATDEFTPPTNSEAIYANSNPATTQLVINEWGAPHARDILEDYDAYKQIVDEFLALNAPGFGLNDGR